MNYNRSRGHCFKTLIYSIPASSNLMLQKQGDFHTHIFKTTHMISQCLTQLLSIDGNNV